MPKFKTPKKLDVKLIKPKGQRVPVKKPKLCDRRTDESGSLEKEKERNDVANVPNINPEDELPLVESFEVSHFIIYTYIIYCVCSLRMVITYLFVEI